MSSFTKVHMIHDKAYQDWKNHKCNENQIERMDNLNKKYMDDISSSANTSKESSFLSNDIYDGVNANSELNAGVVQDLNNSTDETVFPVFVDGATGTQGAETDTGLTYNPSTGILTATGFSGGLTGTLATAAQTNITSVGTLTALAVDNLSLDGNTITASTGALNLTPAAGSALVLDGTINVDAGVVTGATSITSTAFVGGLTGNVTGNVSGTAATVTGAAQTAITSVGTLILLLSTPERPPQSNYQVIFSM